MTPEEKVAMLKKAGVWDVIGFPSCIDKLFDLVAAHEREAIAQMFDDSPKLISSAQNSEGGCLICGFTPKIAAAAIRQQGLTKSNTGE